MRKRNPRRHHFSSRSRACSVLGEVLIKLGYVRSAVRAQCLSHARNLVYLETRGFFSMGISNVTGIVISRCHNHHGTTTLLHTATLRSHVTHTAVVR